MKKLIGAFAAPVAVALLLVALAGIFHWRGRRRVAGWLAITAVVLAYLGSISPVSDGLLRPLERKYPPLASDLRLGDVQYVVVLGSSYWPRSNVPVTAALDVEGVVRAVEGVRISRHYAIPHLVLSGGMANASAPSAVGYAVLARSLGVDDASIILLDRPRDTDEEAAAVKALIGNAPFILVTSAYHMPRAVRLMERAGTRPIPAPTAQFAHDADGILWQGWIPSGRALAGSERALREYVGLLALAMGIA